MADFDAFESAQTGEVDPAADFLAREQQDLAGLEDDNFGGQSEGNQDFGGFDGSPEEQAPVTEQQDNSLGDFEVIGGENTSSSFGGGLLDDGGALGSEEGLNIGTTEETTNGPSNAYEAISQQDTVRAEPEKIRIWREEQKQRLEKKDAEEAARKKELMDVAKKELDDWYKHHVEQLEKTKENNRAAESDFVKERDEKISGQAWEKITKLCEFNPKNSKTTKDVSRFRGILLQLKQTPLVR